MKTGRFNRAAGKTRMLPMRMREGEGQACLLDVPIVWFAESR